MHIMKNFYKFIGGLAVLPAIILSSCKEEEVYDEWNACYVYVQAKDYLRPNNTELNLKYTLEGMEGDTAFIFRVKSQKMPTEDIKVNLGLEGIDGTDVSCMKISNFSPVIKAGEMVSEELKLTFGDYSFIPDTIDVGTFAFNLKIMSVETGMSNVLISPKESNIKLTVNGEGKATTLSLESPDAASSGDVDMRLDIPSDGTVGGDKSFKFNVVTQKAIPNDVKVNLKLEGIDGFDVSNIDLSSFSPVIKAGNLKSEDVTVSFKNEDFITSVIDEKTFSFKVIMESLVTDLDYVKISGTDGSFNVNIIKPAKCRMAAGVPGNSELIADRSVWEIEVESGVENGPGNLVDNNRNTDVAVNNKGFWVIVNLKEKTNVTGLCTYHWGAQFAPSRLKISVSDNGSEWKSLGELKVSGNIQRIKFDDTQEVQYVKYEMIETVSNRVDITEFHVYKAK